MTPPVAVFPQSQLELHVQADVKGKKRKLEGGGDVDLSKCALRAMTQWRCSVVDPDDRSSPVRCWPVERFFRQCHDKKGTFTVETTAWEGPSACEKTNRDSRETQGSKDTADAKGSNGNQRTYHHWSQAWEDER